MHGGEQLLNFIRCSIRAVCPVRHDAAICCIIARCREGHEHAELQLDKNPSGYFNVLRQPFPGTHVHSQVVQVGDVAALNIFQEDW